MPKLKFYDLKEKKSFETDKYNLTSKKTSKGTKYFAKTKSPKKNECWRIVSKDFYKKFKK